MYKATQRKTIYETFALQQAPSTQPMDISPDDYNEDPSTAGERRRAYQLRRLKTEFAAAQEVCFCSWSIHLLRKHFSQDNYRLVQELSKSQQQIEELQQQRNKVNSVIFRRFSKLKEVAQEVEGLLGQLKQTEGERETFRIAVAQALTVRKLAFLFYSISQLYQQSYATLEEECSNLKTSRESAVNELQQVSRPLKHLSIYSQHRRVCLKSPARGIVCFWYAYHDTIFSSIQPIPLIHRSNQSYVLWQNVRFASAVQ